LGLDNMLLNMVPSPCAGVILLFPCTDKMFDVRQAQKQRLLAQAPSPATNAAYHVKQVAEFGNACGTIASVHALINGQVVYQNKKVKNSAMQKFRDANANASPQDRGRALLKTSALRSSSDQSAGHRSAQTACPDVRIFFCFCLFCVGVCLLFMTVQTVITCSLIFVQFLTSLAANIVTKHTAQRP